MKPDPESARKTLLNAQQAMQRGERQAARGWAEQAVALAPDSEESWLFLAALASPRDSVKYLERALKINPRSQRARKGMHWAVERLRREQAERSAKRQATPSQKLLNNLEPARNTQPVSRVPVSIEPKTKPQAQTVPARRVARSAAPEDVRLPRSVARIRWSLLTILLVVICVSLGWAFWPGNASPVLAILHSPHSAPATPLLVWSLFGLILGTFGLLALRGVSSRSVERPALHAAAWVRSLREIRRYIPGFFFGGMGWSVTIFYGPSLLNHKFQIPMGQTGLYLALWIGLGTITGYGYGVWSRRFGRKNVFILSLGGAVISLFLIGFAPHKALAVAGLLAFGGFLLMTYPSLHTFVGSTVQPAGQTMAFSWVSNIQLLSGAFVTLVSGFVSDRIGIQFPFILTGILTLAIFLFYVPRGPEFFGGTQESPPGLDVAPDAAHARSL